MTNTLQTLTGGISAPLLATPALQNAEGAEADADANAFRAVMDELIPGAEGAFSWRQPATAPVSGDVLTAVAETDADQEVELVEGAVVSPETTVFWRDAPVHLFAILAPATEQQGVVPADFAEKSNALRGSAPVIAVPVSSRADQRDVALAAEPLAGADQTARLVVESSRSTRPSVLSAAAASLPAVGASAQVPDPLPAVPDRWGAAQAPGRGPVLVGPPSEGQHSMQVQRMAPYAAAAAAQTESALIVDQTKGHRQPLQANALWLRSGVPAEKGGQDQASTADTAQLFADNAEMSPRVVAAPVRTGEWRLAAAAGSVAVSTTQPDVAANVPRDPVMSVAQTGLPGRARPVGPSDTGAGTAALAEGAKGVPDTKPEFAPQFDVGTPELEWHLPHGPTGAPPIAGAGGVAQAGTSQLPGPVPVELLPQAIATAARSETMHPVSLQLDPIELGTVAFNMDTGPAGLVVTIVAERPETIELLRRHADQFLADLRQSGFQGASLNFSHSGQDQHRQDQHRQDQMGHDQMHQGHSDFNQNGQGQNGQGQNGTAPHAADSGRDYAPVGRPTDLPLHRPGLAPARGLNLRL